MEAIAKELLQDFKFTNALIHQFVDGVSHSESVVQPPFRANCMNWILGHLITRRNSSLQCLGQPALWSEQQLAMYRTGSDPIRSEGQSVPIITLVQDLDETLKRLEAALSEASFEDLQVEVENDRGRKKVVDHLKGFHWHETFHLGQLEMLRSLIESKRSAKE